MHYVRGAANLCVNHIHDNASELRQCPLERSASIRLLDRDEMLGNLASVRQRLEVVRHLLPERESAGAISLRHDRSLRYLARESTVQRMSGHPLAGLKVTRIAMGIPVGSDIEYADEITMLKAMEGRREL